MFIAKNNKTEKFWNKNFLLLWQGQIISCLGDSLYSIALGFWVLDKTKSVSTMGVLMAVITASKIIFGTFSGVFVDRLNRKHILVICDVNKRNCNCNNRYSGIH